MSMVSSGAVVLKFNVFFSAVEALLLPQAARSNPTETVTIPAKTTFNFDMIFPFFCNKKWDVLQRGIHPKKNHNLITSYSVIVFDDHTLEHDK